MKILVTGGTGFIGSNLVKKLCELNHEVTVTGTNTEAKLPPVKKFLNLHFDGLAWKHIEGMDVVFHQAANNDTQMQDEEEMMRANFLATKSLFERARQGGCSKFVYASSTAVYGNSPTPYVEEITPLDPLTHYAKSKVLVDEFAMQFAKDHSVSVIGLRYCNVYGPGEEHKGHRSSMIYQIARQMLKGNRPKLFEHGQQMRDWIYVKDVVNANLAAIDFAGTGIFNCGFGSAISFNQIVQQVNQILGSQLEPEYVTNPFPDSYQSLTLCDTKKAETMFRPEYDPMSGIKEFVEYLLKG